MSQFQWLLRCYEPEIIVFILLETVLEMKFIPVLIKSSLSPIPLLLLHNTQAWLCKIVWLMLAPNSLLHFAYVNPQSLRANTHNVGNIPIWWACFSIFTSEVAKMKYGKEEWCGLSLSQLMMEPKTEHRNSHAGKLSLGWTPPLSLSSEPSGEWPSRCGLCIGLWTLKPAPLWFCYSPFFQWHSTLSWTSPVLFPNHQLPFAYILKYGWERMAGRWVNLHLIHSTVTMRSRNRV